MSVTKTPILIVDDRRANLFALEAMLESPEYEIVSARSGSEALEQFEKRDFAVVLLDLQMPTMDGIETAQRMKARAPQLGRRAPIMVVTAFDTDRAEVLKAYANGAVDFIQKPLEPAVLTAKVAVFADLFRARELAKRSVAKLGEEQQKAEEESRRFRLLVESVKDYAIFILDPTGVVATWNPGAERIKGYKASEIIGKHFSIFYTKEEAASGKCERELEIATDEGVFEEEGWRLRKDGSGFWANVTITALRDRESGNLIGFAKVTRDLTERRQHEEALRALAAEKAALAEKARIQEFQERFIAVLGHDLRNPLSAIDMGTALLRQRVDETKDQATTRVLDRMKASSRRMTRMIEQILDLTRSRLAGGLEMNPESIDLSRTIVSIAEELRTAHPDRAIEVQAPSSMIGTWDLDRLEQVFSNLIGNAVAYGPAGRPVQVSVDENGGSVSVSVHNDGPPIPDALRVELFSPFRRGARDSKTAETAGLGLGLYISREIVLAHGGEIDVHSTSTEGTTFRVTLPRSAPLPKPKVYS